MRESQQIVGENQVAKPENAPHVDLAGQLVPLAQALAPATREIVTHSLAIGPFHAFHDGVQNQPRSGQ